MGERKVALVTGGSRGIGRAVCEKLARMGMDVALTYNSGQDAAEETVRLCSQAGVDAKSYKANVADPEVCRELVQSVMDDMGGLDVLVNNAGITRDNLIMRMSDEDFSDVIETNLKGAFYMMREASRIMLKQKSGKIVNISSVVGLMGNAGQVNYSASKAGVIGMTKSLAKELASRHINVNAVAPGMIDTDMTKVLSDKTRESILAAIPFGEMGSAKDVAAAVGFLCSDDAGYITGEVIRVDGGMAI